MKLWDRFVNWIFNKDKKIDVALYMDGMAKLSIELLAINSAINMIASALSLSEFMTFEKGKEVRKSNYYLFNVEPNINMSASQFWKKVISQLVYDNECLILQEEAGLFVADSFEMKEFAFKESLYFNIEINGLKLERTFSESEVIHLKLYNDSVKKLIDNVASEYDELISYSKKTYKRSNARRGILEIPTSYPNTPEAIEKLQDLMNNKFKKFFEAENGAVLPIANGMKYDDLSNNTYKNGSDSRDIRYLIDDIFDFVAVAFQIPPQLLKGTTQDTAPLMESFVGLCINPIAELIKDEVNRKYYGKTLFLEKTYLRIETSNILIVKIGDVANALDVLFRCGVNTINDNLKILGREESDDPICNKRFITKNYTEGGEMIGEEKD